MLNRYDSDSDETINEHQNKEYNIDDVKKIIESGYYNDDDNNSIDSNDSRISDILKKESDLKKKEEENIKTPIFNIINSVEPSISNEIPKKIPKPVIKPNIEDMTIKNLKKDIYDIEEETLNNNVESKMPEMIEKQIANSSKYLSKEDLDDISQLVKMWYVTDDLYSKKLKEAKEIKQEKKQFEDLIIEILDTVKRDEVETDKGTIMKNVTIKKRGLKEEDMIKALSKLCNDKEKITKITEEIIGEIPETQTVNIKKKNDKKTNKKKT